MRRKTGNCLLGLMLSASMFFSGMAGNVYGMSSADSETIISLEEEKLLEESGTEGAMLERGRESLALGVLDEGLIEDPDVTAVADSSAAQDTIEDLETSASQDNLQELEVSEEQDAIEDPEDSVTQEAAGELETDQEVSAVEGLGSNLEPETEALTEGETSEEEIDALVEEPDSETELLENEAKGDVITATGSIQLEDASLVRLTSNDGGNRNKAAMARSLASYNGRFGNQLSGYAKTLYDQRVSYYATNQNTGVMSLSYTAGNSPITFTASYTSAKSLNQTTASYKAAVSELVFAMQSSLDAFLYDYPEIFWLRGGSISYVMAAQGNQGYVSRIYYQPSQAFTNAASYLASFNSSVKSVASTVRSGADYDADGHITDVELARAAHDYLCQRLYYDHDSFATYEQTNDYRIFCAAGAFLNVGNGVVCEGYAKAYKVLCNALGLSCVIIGGDVTYSSGSSEGHMWNGIYLNGGWYLVDVTWDDDTIPSYDYFLVSGSIDSRTASGNFSGAASGTTTIFVYPALKSSSMAFCTKHNYKAVKSVAATCSKKGYTEYKCSVCGALYNDNYTALNKNNHTFVNGKCSGCGTYDTIPHATVSAVKTQYYTGNLIVPSVTVKFGSKKLVKGTDYTVSCSNNRKRGTATMILTGKGNYKGSRKITFRIARRPVSKLQYSSITSVTYNGSIQSPSLTLRNGSLKLKKGTDYTISYSNNRKVGTAVITVTGKGNYTGTRKLYFQIIPKKPAITALTSPAQKRLKVSWTSVSGSSGYQIQYSTSSTFVSAKTKTITVSASVHSRVISVSQRKTNYYVRVRDWKQVNGKMYYSRWTGKSRKKVR